MNARFDRSRLLFHPLSDRVNRIAVGELLAPRTPSVKAIEAVRPIAEAIRASRLRGAGRVLAFGAHTIKNGMGPVIARLFEGGWLTHGATNGAGIIHDWELAYLGETSEHVRENVERGMFGMWEETVATLNLAIDLGAYRGYGYGESVGRLVADGGLDFPGFDELGRVRRADDLDRAAAAADLEAVMRRLEISGGFRPISHRYAEVGLQARALGAGVPYTAHPMFGHDIIYTHPACSGAAIGRCADRDFLTYAASIADLEGGVYLSVGSAVMSPMIFEKSLSMARNVAIASGGRIADFDIFAVDLADSTWDWVRDGEPPSTNPAYYVRFCKSFSRMGGRFHYLSLDAVELFPALEELLAE
jgi:hypothetical protein